MPNARRTARTAMLAMTAALVAAASVADAADRYWPPIVDPATGQHNPGRWVWADLVTSDVAVAADFYGKVFGWTFETYGGEDDRDTYTLALAAGLPVGGMMFDQRALKDNVPSARWIGLVSVPDVHAVADAVSRSGGKVVFPPKALGERGDTAVFKDPEGTLFGAVHSKNGDPDDYAGDLNEWLWLDLWTSDVERAAKFYSTVVGYDVLPVQQDRRRSGVRLVSGGFARAGIMQKADARDTPVWLPYLRVADARAAADQARAAGGKVLREPVSLGRLIVAVVADPTGAPVGIAQLNEQEAPQ